MAIPHIPHSGRALIGFAVAFCFAAASPSSAQEFHPVFEAPRGARVVPPQSAKLDSFVAEGLQRAGLRRPNPCSDAVFLRRASLDLTGTLPTAEETRAFLADPSPKKRAALIDRLLASEAYADFWGMRWCDLLRVKSEFPVNLWPNAAQAYDRWIRESIRQNRPYSELAARLLEAEGSNFRDPEVNFYRSAGSRSPEVIAGLVASTFLGERFGSWPEAKRKEFARFFSRIGYKKTSEWKEEIVFFDATAQRPDAPAASRLPDGTAVSLGPDDDPRKPFVRWLLAAPGSPFARNGANRLWFWVFGRGIVHEPDDARPDNPPSNPALLDYLAKEFAASKYDAKQMLRILLNSETYQASSLPLPGGKVPPPETFAAYRIRPLEAEVLIDAINRITGGREEYMSMIPEPFSFLPQDARAVAVPDGSITSTFLELFGRPPRDTGSLLERGTRVSPAQRLHLLNSNHILGKINRSDRLKKIESGAKTPQEAAENLYLTILSRYPTEEEWATIQSRSKPGGGKGQTFTDLAWALINSPEFSMRH